MNIDELRDFRSKVKKRDKRLFELYKHEYIIREALEEE